MRILRLRRPTTFLTATVFEELFSEQLGAVSRIDPVRADVWWRDVLGPPEAALDLGPASTRLPAALAGADFFAPDYEASLLAPLFLLLRNRAAVATRLLLVAHSPATAVFEWAMMGRLLAPGDLIVAPSRSAAELIAFLSADVAPFVTVIPHPMLPLGPPSAVRTRSRVVSLGRIHPGKLLHRQIEALAILRQRRELPLMEIAGEPSDVRGDVYRRSLTVKVSRLGLGEHVRFVGAIRGREAKAAFLAHADALVNLSATVEESFGKAPIEALGLGVPVLATRWDGLPETVGDGGVLLPMDVGGPGVPADVSAASIATGLAQLLDAPPTPASCRAQAARCDPARIVPAYRSALERAARESRSAAFPQPPDPVQPAVPAGGLLSEVAPLTSLTWSHTLSSYVEICATARRAWDGAASEPSSAERLRAQLLNATRWPIERFMATPLPSDESERAALSNTTQLPARLAGLAELAANADRSELEGGLAVLEAEGQGGAGLQVLRAEAAGLAGRWEEAFDHAARGIDLFADHEVTAFRLRQLARVARAGGWPERALPSIASWLEHFPDSPDSGTVWLDRCVNATEAGAAHAGDANVALARARALLGDLPVLDKIGRRLSAFRAAAELGAAVE
jgi:glycosyltransferase involved in cell wall biosynthesis